MDTPNARTVSIPHPTKTGQSLEGYLVMPPQATASKPLPGMLILHEAYGVSDNIRVITQRFASEGYVALAADLFSDGGRAICMFRAMYGLLVSPLRNGTVNNVRAAFDYLKKQPGVDGKRMGAIGFCMGGSYALELACLDNTVSAISVVSGQNPRPLDAVERACPVVGSYAEGDFMAGPGRKLDIALHEYKIPHDIKIYAGGIHSLFNTDAKGYDPKIGADAWARTLGFFDQHIRVG